MKKSLESDQAQQRLNITKRAADGVGNWPEASEHLLPENQGKTTNANIDGQHREMPADDENDEALREWKKWARIAAIDAANAGNGAQRAETETHQRERNEEQTAIHVGPLPAKSSFEIDQGEEAEAEDGSMSDFTVDAGGNEEFGKFAADDPRTPVILYLDQQQNGAKMIKMPPPMRNEPNFDAENGKRQGGSNGNNQLLKQERTDTDHQQQQQHRRKQLLTSSATKSWWANETNSTERVKQLSSIQQHPLDEITGTPILSVLSI